MAIMPPMGAMKTTHSAKELIQDAKNLSLNPILFQVMTKVIYAELSGDFPLGDSRQPTYKSLRPFDLVS